MVKGERRRKGRVEENNKILEYKKGLWSSEEDRLLLEHVKVHGKGKWNRIPQLTGLKRCGKSCRLRWMNYLSPNIKTGDFSQEEDDLIIRLHKLLGNRWSLIAGRVPGRTDNQVKNYWNSHLSKKLGIKKGKAKLLQATSEHQSPTNKGESSSDIPSMEELKERSSEEISGLENQNENLRSLISEDDDLIVNNQSLFDFLSEYCLDYTWSNGL